MGKIQQNKTKRQDYRRKTRGAIEAKTWTDRQNRKGYIIDKRNINE